MSGGAFCDFQALWKREAFCLFLFLLLLLLTDRCISAYWPRGFPIDFFSKGSHSHTTPQLCLLTSWVCFTAKSVPQSHRISLQREDCCRESSVLTSLVVSQSSQRHLYLPGSTGRTSAWEKLTALVKEIAACSFTKLLCHKLDIQGQLLEKYMALWWLESSIIIWKMILWAMDSWWP